MKLSFKIILSTLLLLSLIVLGENILITCPSVKYDKETEWLSTGHTKTEHSISYYSLQFIDDAASDLKQFWTKDHILYYNQMVAIIIISQTSQCCETLPFYLLNNRSYIPRKSMEPHSIS